MNFTELELLNRYPNLPPWAINAFFDLQEPKKLWKPEARALLNMAYVAPTCVPLHSNPPHVGASSKDLKDLFKTEDDWVKAKEEIDLWRLSRDLAGAMKEG